MKSYPFITFLIFIICCTPTENNIQNEHVKRSTDIQDIDPRAIELNNKAIKISMNFDLDSIGNDSALYLLDQATKIDSNYFLGYSNKIQFLLRKGDFDRLLKTNKKIIKLRPNQPGWIVHRGLIYELNDQMDKAEFEYLRGIKKFEELKEQANNWEFQLAYAESLVLTNNYSSADKIVTELKREKPDLHIWSSYKLKTKRTILEEMKKTITWGKKP